MAEDKRFYWLKLKKDFFKRHDVTILEGLPNGKEYLLFYLKLLVESIDHDGILRFSDTLPYTPEMLASIMKFDVETVREALHHLSQFGMIEILEDGSIVLNEEERMVGYETKWAEKKRTYRGHKEDTSRTMSSQCPQDVLENEDTPRTQEGQFWTMSDKSKSKRKSKSKSKNIEKVKKEKVAFGSFQNVLLTEEEHERLLAKYGAEAEEAIEYLSAYIIEKKYKSESHNLSIQRWVIDAVRERKAKQKKAPAKPNALNDTYARIAQFVEEVDE